MYAHDAVGEENTFGGILRTVVQVLVVDIPRHSKSRNFFKRHQLFVPVVGSSSIDVYRTDRILLKSCVALKGWELFGSSLWGGEFVNTQSLRA